jgi:hypothetical protein
MTHFPEPRAPIIFTLAVCPGQFVQADPGSRDDLVGRFMSPDGEVWLMIDARQNANVPMERLVEIIDTNPVTQLMLILTELGPTRIRATFAPGAELFLSKHIKRRKPKAAAEPALTGGQACNQLSLPAFRTTDA